MKQFRILSILSASAFYPFSPHPHFILFVRIRILSLLSASAFYPFCPHPHFILFVRIRILSLLSASAFYPFCPSVRLSVRVSVRPYPRFIPTRFKKSVFGLGKLIFKLLLRN
jgi:hypothetical protein